MSKLQLVLDIYHGNRGIDLAEWKARHGLWAIIAKCGGSEDSHWNRFEETTFVNQCQQARALGLHVGAYYYSDALDTKDALLDAKHCVEKCMRGQRLDMPLYLDIEKPAQLRLPMYQLTDIVTTWCEYVRQAGYMPGIYSGYDGFHNMFESRIQDYALWVAAWRASWPIWAKDYGMWQQGSMRLSDGDIQYDDVSGYVDCNWCQVDYPTIIEEDGIMPEPKWALSLAECRDPADWAYCTCAVYSCGYSQPNRKHISVDYLEAGTAETDCSAGVSYWLYKGGYLDENPWFHTAIEREYLRDHGFEVIDANAGFVKMQRNDVLLRERNDARGITGHTALYIGEGYQAEALRTERGDAGYDGSTPGDQDGGETVVRPLTYDWDWVIRKPGPKPSTPTPTTGDTMTCIISMGGNDNMWLYDGGRLIQIQTEEQQETLKYMHLQATGNPMPQFHVPNGSCLINLLI